MLKNNHSISSYWGPYSSTKTGPNDFLILSFLMLSLFFFHDSCDSIWSTVICHWKFWKLELIINWSNNWLQLAISILFFKAKSGNYLSNILILVVSKVSMSVITCCKDWYFNKKFLDLKKLRQKFFFNFITRHKYNDVSQSTSQGTNLFPVLRTIQFCFICNIDQISHISNLKVH